MTTPSVTRYIAEDGRAMTCEGYERAARGGWIGKDFAKSFRAMQAAGDWNGKPIGGDVIQRWQLATDRTRIAKLNRAIDSSERPVSAPTREQMYLNSVAVAERLEHARLAVVDVNQRHADRYGYNDTPEGAKIRSARRLKHDNILRRLRGERPPVLGRYA